MDEPQQKQPVPRSGILQYSKKGAGESLPLFDRPSSAVAAPDSRVHSIKLWWVDAWQKKYGVPYAWAGREAKVAKDLLRYVDTVSTDGLEGALALLRVYLEDTDTLVVKNQHPFTTICKSPHRWQVKLMNKSEEDKKKDRKKKIIEEGLRLWALMEQGSECGWDSCAAVALKSIGGIKTVLKFKGTETGNMFKHDFMRAYVSQRE